MSVNQVSLYLPTVAPFSQILPYHFSWQANSNTFTASTCKTFSFPEAPHTLLNVLLLSFLLLLQGPNTLKGPHHILFWKGQYYAKSNVLPTSWACIFCCASVAGCLLLSTIWMGFSSLRWWTQYNFLLCLRKSVGPTLGLDSVCIFTHVQPIEACPLKFVVKADLSAGSISLVMYFFQFSLGFLLPHTPRQDPTWHSAVQFSPY